MKLVQVTVSKRQNRLFNYMPYLTPHNFSLDGFSRIYALLMISLTPTLKANAYVSKLNFELDIQIRHFEITLIGQLRSFPYFKRYTLYTYIGWCTICVNL